MGTFEIRPARLKNIIADKCLKLLLFLLKTYRYLLSPWLGSHCRFHPSCSEYAQEALMHYGIIQGLWLTLRRLLRCHPFHPGGYDPAVPICSPKRELQSSLPITGHHPTQMMIADCEPTSDKNKEI